jgi:hypothetical protein
MEVIKLDQNQRPRFCYMAALHISDLLNTKITFNEVLDELFLYERGELPNDRILSQYVIELLENLTIKK